MCFFWFDIVINGYALKQYKLLIANGNYLKQVRIQRLGFYNFNRRKLLAFLVGIDCYDIIIVVFVVSIL